MKWFFTFLIFESLAVTVLGAEVNTTTPSCFTAEIGVNETQTRQKCLPYQYPNGHCKHYLSNFTVFVSKENQEKNEEDLRDFENSAKLMGKYKQVMSRQCLKAFFETYCYWWFPKCDVTSPMVTGRPLCRETCEYATTVCAKELEFAKVVNNQEVPTGYYRYSYDLINCTHFQYRNGGDSPECYYRNDLNTETDKLQDKGCYYGNGLGYRGNVNVTRSGQVCQSWSSQCPHRHDHPLSEYPELINASNWCRNPGGQAPNGPWCYTTSTSTRWEYCNVRRCPAPGPSQSPKIVQAFSTGPHKIAIEWRPVPFPFVHGNSSGFRIKIEKLNSNSYSVINTTSPETNYFEMNTLQPLTDYSLSVLEFNENQDGPWSSPVHVQTMPRNFASVRILMILRNKKFDSSLYERDTTKYKDLETIVQLKIRKLYENTTTYGYKVFKSKIIRFFNGSVGVELDITAELLTSTSWSATQDITRRILKDSAASKDDPKSLRFTSLLVKASPPPPVDISQSDVSLTSVIIGWSAPAHSEPFRITNYTVQYKKSGTTMSYYDAAVVGSDKKKSVVENLDSNTKYLMRVRSINAYGSQPSQYIVVQTKAFTQDNLPIAAIVTSLVIMAAILIGASIFIWRWRHKKRLKKLQLKARIARLRKNPYESAVNWFDLLKIDVGEEWWEIPRDDLILEHEIGSGQYGIVLKGFLKNGGKRKQNRGMHCAVKMLKDNPTERELRDLCNEINIMSKIGDHPNIVSLIGACSINGPPLLVVKLAPNGCLLDYLKENRPLPEYENVRDTTSMPKVISKKERLKFGYEIAQGMSHLEKHKYVHRDLAARNILLGKKMVAMISDFGLSRDVYDAGIYENAAGGFLPVRWMARETLTDYIYTSETDVWSYGVLLWEIETGGIVPYGGLSGLEILEKLKEGYRLEKPLDTSRELYSIMWKCWNPDPKQRPTFADLVYQVGGLLSYYGGYNEALFNGKQGSTEDLLHDNHLNLESGGEPVIVDKNAIPLDNIAIEMKDEHIG